MIHRFIFINISPALTPMSPSLITRFLAVDDIAALLELESQQWTPDQAADADTLAQRIAAYPQLCIGTFCTRTGKVLASLFMRPTTADDVRHARCWMECAAIMPVKQTGVASRSGRSLFGISLTSIDAQAASALFAFFWPYALKNGWRDIYLGSPLPGLKRAFENDAKLDVHTYARARRGKLPRDPQLRYYHRKGFKHLVAVKPDYFPHEASLNHGAVLRGKVPLSQWSALWRRLPLTILRRLLESILRFEDWYADSLLASAIPLRALR